MGRYDIELGPELPSHGFAVKFLPGDKEEVKAWAREHAQPGWHIQGGHNDHMYTLIFNHKEGDTADFPFTYIWDGEKIVKSYFPQESGE